MNKFPLYDAIKRGAVELIATADFPTLNTLEGDIHRIELDSFDENSITVWEQSGVTSKIFCGFVYENFGELSAFTATGKIINFPKSEMKLIGKVVGIIKRPPTFEDFITKILISEVRDE